MATVKMSSKIFDFSFFYSGSIEVTSLTEGAELYGGATQLRDGSIYSNIEKDEFISINEGLNTMSIYVPSTIDINVPIDNRPYVEDVLNKMLERYPLNDLFVANTSGSWYSDELGEVVIEDITIAEMHFDTLTELDVFFFKKIAETIKEEMRQSGVSLQINDSLAIV